MYYEKKMFEIIFKTVALPGVTIEFNTSSPALMSAAARTQKVPFEAGAIFHPKLF